MDKLNTLLVDQASLKRFVVMLIGVLAIVLNKKLGLNLDDTQQALLATMITAFIVSSNSKEKAIIQAEAFGVQAGQTVKTVSEAEAVLKGGKASP